MKAAIVTGANGFVGYWLVNILSQKNVKTYAVVRDVDKVSTRLKKLENVVICDRETLQEYVDQGLTTDVFYHLAWSGTGGQLREDYSVQLENVQIACSYAEIALKMNCNKFIATGTISERLIETNQDIDCLPKVFTYGICKNTCRLLLKAMLSHTSTYFIWAQLSNIYGFGNNTGNILDYTIKKFKSGESPEYSYANQVYDFMYVKDTAKALWLLGSNQVNHDYYFLGSGEPKVLKEYLLNLKRIQNFDGELHFGVRKDQGFVYQSNWFEIDNLVNDTGFSTDYSFETGFLDMRHDEMEVL